MKKILSVVCNLYFSTFLLTSCFGDYNKKTALYQAKLDSMEVIEAKKLCDSINLKVLPQDSLQKYYTQRRILEGRIGFNCGYHLPLSYDGYNPNHKKQASHYKNIYDFEVNMPIDMPFLKKLYDFHIIRFVWSGSNVSLPEWDKFKSPFFGYLKISNFLYKEKLILKSYRTLKELDILSVSADSVSIEGETDFKSLNLYNIYYLNFAKKKYITEKLFILHSNGFSIKKRKGNIFLDLENAPFYLFPQLKEVEMEVNRKNDTIFRQQRNKITKNIKNILKKYSNIKKFRYNDIICTQ